MSTSALHLPPNAPVLWRERLGLPREPRWDLVRKGLSAPIVADGRYLFPSVAAGTYGLEAIRLGYRRVLRASTLLDLPGHALMLQLEGFSLAQISQITHQGEETVKSRLRYARQQLHTLSGEHDE